MYVCAFFALCSAWALGCILGWSGIALDSLKKNESIPHIRTIDDGTQTHPDDLEYETWMSSCVTLTALIGSLMSGFLTKFIGRRKTLIGMSIPTIIGWALICYAKSFIVIIIGRSITGFCCGVISGTTPGYIADISTPKTRGFLGTSFQIMICFGELYLICFGTLLEWNQLAYMAIIPVIISSVGMVFAPESPITFIERDNEKGALKMLTMIRTKSSDIDDELKELKERIENKRLNNVGSGIGILKRVDVYNPTIIAILLNAFQQLSGVNAIMFYLTNIFEGGSSIPSNVAAIMVSGALVGATLLSGFIVDKFGRKVLLLTSGIGHIVTLTIMGVYYKFIEPDCGWIPVVCLIVFVIVFSLGFGPIPWMIVGEVTPNEAMPLVSSLGSATNWLCAFIVTKEFKSLIQAINKCGTYWLFSSLSAVSVIYIYFFVPETKQRSIEQMQHYFLNKK
ncbi:hypothetical protein RDWZM_003029 [Blomia tropicalis]|uniref:Major facilitator superfamily (MFS) profile domain-containing protein n=1 Tax=Blomia tropicalis TaxID=40697 RepID=A0A9Q0RS48_BLOTA|nr:hypothetical protein RDWZM_003029 [Blomia tropicalis]